MASSHSYEDASLVQMKSWFKTLPQNPLPIYPIGPLLPPGYGRLSEESSGSKNGQVERDLQPFLKEMQAKHGDRSVVFVGFPLTIGCLKCSLFSDFLWHGLLAYGAGIYRRGRTSAYR